MTYTNFPNGITSFGVPVIGGIGGIPLTGNWYFVDYANGSDGAEGSPENPLKTLLAAYNKCTVGNNDVVVIVGDGSTTASQRLSASLTWAKNATHLIGMTAPTMIGQRARITTLTTQTTNINPLMTISASGCLFMNFSTFQGVGEASTDEQLINITGARNYFANVQFGGMGHTNGAGRAGSYVMKLDAGEENTFDSCVIGLDTIARSAANASVKLVNAAKRNVFLNCIFPVYATATSPLVIDGNAVGSVDRFNLFKNCAILNSGSSALAAVVGYNASQGGFTVMDNCSAMNCSDWTAADTSVVQISGPVPNGDTSGMMVDSDKT